MPEGEYSNPMTVSEMVNPPEVTGILNPQSEPDTSETRRLADMVNNRVDQASGLLADSLDIQRAKQSISSKPISENVNMPDDWDEFKKRHAIIRTAESITKTQIAEAELKTPTTEAEILNSIYEDEAAAKFELSKKLGEEGSEELYADLKQKTGEFLVHDRSLTDLEAVSLAAAKLFNEKGVDPLMYGYLYARALAELQANKLHEQKVINDRKAAMDRIIERSSVK